MTHPIDPDGTAGQCIINVQVWIAFTRDYPVDRDPSVSSNLGILDFIPDQEVAVVQRLQRTRLCRGRSKAEA